MFHWITKCDFGRDRDTVSAPTEEVELSDPPPYLAGEDEPSAISSFSRKEGKKRSFLFCRDVFFFCKFHFYVFYNLS